MSIMAVQPVSGAKTISKSEIESKLLKTRKKNHAELIESLKRWPYLFRNPQQKELLEIANMYMGLGQFDIADNFADQIMSAVIVNSKRPLMYDEAVFIKSDVRRIKGYKILGDDKNGAKKYFFESFKLLYENYKKLMPDEYGYKSAYSSKMLVLLVEYKEVFKENMCDSMEFKRLFQQHREKPFTYRDLLENATDKYNRFNGGINIFNQPLINEPANRAISSFFGTYNDNFIVVRSKIAYTKYLISLNRGKYIAEAEKMLNIIFDFIESIDNSLPNNKIPRINKYDLNSTIESAAIGARIIGSRMGIAKKDDDDKFEFPVFYQYDPKNFLYFKSQALLAKANIEIFKIGKADTQEEKEGHLSTALNYFSEAYKLSNDIKKISKINFYTGAKWEERKGHCAIALEYAKVLIIDNPSKAKELLQEIIDLYNITKDPQILREKTWAQTLMKELEIK